MKLPELELESELKLWAEGGVGVGVGVETLGVGVGVGVETLGVETLRIGVFFSIISFLIFYARSWKHIGLTVKT